MKIRFISVLILFVVALSVCSCGNSSKAADQQVKETPDAPFARLQVPLKVDMGDFDSNTQPKTVTLEVANTGTDTLYILGVMPDCECTTAAIADSVIAPMQKTTLTATLDLRDFLAGDVDKAIAIASNNIDGKFTRLRLVGHRK